jgi:hypothetical protein
MWAPSLVLRKGVKIGGIFFMIEAKREEGGDFVGVARDYGMTVCKEWRLSVVEALQLKIGSLKQMIMVLMHRLTSTNASSSTTDAPTSTTDVPSSTTNAPTITTNASSSTTDASIGQSIKAIDPRLMKEVEMR